MSLAFLQIENLRNIRSLRSQLHSRFNIITGINGSGKTSFLEAVYLLGSGHSFRTREISPLVNHDQSCLTIFAKTTDEQTVSIQKSFSAPTQVRLNGYPCKSSSELAFFLPCQVFYQDIFQIIDAGPSVRRSLLNWGLFHVKQNYHELWKNYKRVLKQRNTLLRQKANQKNFEPWDIQLVDLAEQLHILREDYFFQLNQEFQRILPQVSNLSCKISYYKGWGKRNNDKSLLDILKDSYHSDLMRQFTQYGPHQADLMIESNELKAKAYLSRGQQKIILLILKLTQALLISHPCTFICDDLSAELDKDHLIRLMTLVNQIKGQFFITAINIESLPTDYLQDSFLHLNLPY